MQRACVVLLLACTACGSSDDRAPADAGTDASIGTDAGGGLDAGGVDAGAIDSGGVDSGGVDAGAVDAGGRAGIDGDRDRLLATYLAYLQAHPTETQSNGLRGSDLTSVCDLWSHLNPSGQAVFLTLTARLDGSRLGVDGSSMLSHVTAVYRCVGGTGATATDPGTCGGDGNRMFMSMDATLQAALVAANDHAGAAAGGVFDISDIPPGGSWRDSHDTAGAHAPFDTSDETNDGAPRGQTQFFRDPTSAAASMPLGRTDVAALVDPYALEFDQDYDCVHASNPLCSYITYGMLCFPGSSMVGIDLYGSNYGAVDPAWLPAGC